MTQKFTANFTSPGARGEELVMASIYVDEKGVAKVRIALPGDTENMSLQDTHSLLTAINYALTWVTKCSNDNSLVIDDVPKKRS